MSEPPNAALQAIATLSEQVRSRSPAGKAMSANHNLDLCSVRRIQIRREGYSTIANFAR
jgi:hypothetical protein